MGVVIVIVLNRVRHADHAHVIVARAARHAFLAVAASSALVAKPLAMAEGVNG